MHRAVNNGFVVTEHEGFITEWYAKVTKGITLCLDLLNTKACCHEFRAICGSLDATLFLGKPVDRRTIQPVKDTGYGFSRDEVVAQIGINMSGNNYKFAEWCRCIIGYVLGSLLVFRFPVVCKCRDV